MEQSFVLPPASKTSTLLDVLRLIRTRNVGPVTFYQLIARYGTAAEALERLPELAARGGAKRQLVPCTVQQAQREIEQTQRIGATLLTFQDPNYPALLKAIADAPPVLIAKGRAAPWSHQRLLAMVGARNASANACTFAQKLAADVTEAGLVVVSGLARGIDTFAHKGALKKGATVAVIAGGIDNIYPPENEKLYGEIMERGAIITEQPVGMAPVAASFPSRNRIIAGMSEATLVVEASFKSGSLITARMAADQGREVLAVPGFPLDPRAAGTNALIKDGATLIENSTDVLNAYGALARRIRETTPHTYAHAQAHDADEHTLAHARALVAEKLGFSPVPIDELLSQCQLTTGLLFTVLMELELAGRLSRHPGPKVSLKEEG